MLGRQSTLVNAGQELQCHEAMQPRVLSFVDDIHSAATKLLHNAIVRDSGMPGLCATIFEG